MEFTTIIWILGVICAFTIGYALGNAIGYLDAVITVSTYYDTVDILTHLNISSFATKEGIEYIII